MQLQEAFIMSLAKGVKSQYSKNKNGFETWGGGALNNVQWSQKQLACKASGFTLCACASVSVSISSVVHSLVTFTLPRSTGG